MCLECIIFGKEKRLLIPNKTEMRTDTGQIVLLKVRELFLGVAKISSPFWLVGTPASMLVDSFGDWIRFICVRVCLFKKECILQA